MDYKATNIKYFNILHIIIYIVIYKYMTMHVYIKIHDNTYMTY